MTWMKLDFEMNERPFGGCQFPRRKDENARITVKGLMTEMGRGRKSEQGGQAIFVVLSRSIYPRGEAAILSEMQVQIGRLGFGQQTLNDPLDRRAIAEICVDQNPLGVEGPYGKSAASEQLRDFVGLRMSLNRTIADKDCMP
jgi:hypothetical protein